MIIFCNTPYPNDITAATQVCSPEFGLLRLFRLHYPPRAVLATLLATLKLVVGLKELARAPKIATRGNLAG
jgi:hypothetical protein